MSGYSSARRRRRRRQTSAIRRTPEQLRQQERRHHLAAPQILAFTAVGVICAALIALIWITTGRAVREQYEDARGRAEAAVSAQAATLALQAQHELLMIDQSLAVLQTAWNSHPDTFKLTEWRKNMPALTDVSDDLFIANDQHVIVQDILPAAVGQGIGSAYAKFGTGSLEPIQLGAQNRDNAMVVGELGQAGIVREYLMYLVRPLAQPNGWIIGASYRSKALTDAFAAARLGSQGIAALIDSHRGGVQALAGVAALQPRLAIGNSPLYNTIVAHKDSGIWIGRTPIDGVNRIIAFHHVVGRDLSVLVGVASGEALAPAAGWAAGANAVAVMATLLVLGISAAVLWELWHWRRNQRRQRALSQAQGMVTSLQSELAGLRQRSAADSAQLQAVLHAVNEGVAVFDSELRLLRWNGPFPALCGVGGDMLQEGMALELLLRRQIEAGQPGPAADIQAEIDRRVALLQPEAGVAELTEPAADGTPRFMRAERSRDGTLVLVMRGALAAVPVAVQPEIAMASDADPAATDPVEW